jgi:hypothetical protein
MKFCRCRGLAPLFCAAGSYIHILTITFQKLSIRMGTMAMDQACDGLLTRSAFAADMNRQAGVGQTTDQFP